MSVRLRHPDLPEDQTITVPDQRAAAHHRAAGWEPVDGPEPETRPAFADAKAATESKQSPAADAAPEPAPDTAPRRRATKEAEKQ